MRYSEIVMSEEKVLYLQKLQIKSIVLYKMVCGNNKVFTGRELTVRSLLTTAMCQNVVMESRDNFLPPLWDLNKRPITS